LREKVVRDERRCGVKLEKEEGIEVGREKFGSSPRVGHPVLIFFCSPPLLTPNHVSSCSLSFAIESEADA